MNRWGICFLVAVLSCWMSTTKAYSSTFTDWTSIDSTNNIAIGTIDTTTVTFTGSDIDYGVTNSSSSVFNRSVFAPPLSNSDLVSFLSHPNTYHYSLVFSKPIENPVIHLNSLASNLVFSTDNITKLSGDSDFTVSGNTVSGVVHSASGSSFSDSNGSILFTGTYDSIFFSATFPYFSYSGYEGIQMQVGSNVPIPATLWLLGSGFLGLIGIRKRI